MIAVTFDVDDVCWTSEQPCNEMIDAVPPILRILDANPDVVTTWFIRIDAGIEHRRGTVDALLTAHSGTIAALRGGSHEIAWHHHAVVPGTDATPNSDVAYTCRELRRLSPIARDHGMTSVRLGWAQSHADVIACLDDLGWRIDSTALPRPAYPWDTVARDWEKAPRIPYFPTRGDHRATGTDVHAILEVPLSVATLPIESDTVPDVVRYINPAYHPHHFGRALTQLDTTPVIVTVTHPYETCAQDASAPTHPLLAFDVGALNQNLELLRRTNRRFITMRHLVA